MGKSPLLALVLSLAGCTSVPDASVAGSGGLAVSCRKDPAFRAAEYQALLCTFENHGDEPLQAEVTALRFAAAPGAEVPEVVSGSELVAVGDARAAELRGGRAARGGFAPVAAVAVGGSGGGNLAGVAIAGALLLATVAVAAADADEAATPVPLAQTAPKAFDAHHVLGGAFTVPPGLPVRRYAIVRWPDARPLPCGLRLTLAAPEAETLAVALTSDVRARVGQTARCDEATLP